MTPAAAAFVWAAGSGHLVVTPDAGEHINADAPSSLRVDWAPDAPGTHPVVAIGRVEGAGDLGAWHLALGRARPNAVLTVDAAFSVCRDDGSACEVVELTGSAPWTARGELRLATSPGAAPVLAAGPALVGASSPSAVGIYDFAAVWCPPCNLLAAEVLDRPDYAGPRLTHVDVDSPESWALKTRYHVGGYPTLVAVDASGAEIGRLVGYPGRDAALAWIAGLKDRGPLDVAVASASGAGLARLARELAESGDERARELVARAAETTLTVTIPVLPEGGPGPSVIGVERHPTLDGFRIDRDAPPTVPSGVIDLRIARLLLDGAPDDARWLFEHEVPGGDWVYSALQADPQLATRVPALVPGADGEAAAGWLAAAADAAEQHGGERAVVDALRAGALAGLEAARAGDLALDRGRLTDLAELRAALGDVPSAYALLDEAAARWPTEFTWPFVKSRIALDAKDAELAERTARTALANAEGDQVLRASMALARALHAEGRGAEAVAVLDAALARVPEPPAGMAVRTTRYRAEVGKLRAEVGN